MSPTDDPSFTALAGTMADSSEPAANPPPLQRTRIRVPREDSSILAIPPLSDVPALIEANSKQLSDSNVEIAGRSLTSLREDTRRQAVEAAAEFTSSLTGQPHDFGKFDRVIASGHQPELFHPGVWIKNFAVSRLADATDSVGLNLIVDSDTVSSHQIRIPGGSPEQPVFESLAFDSPGEVMPWEEARIQDESLLASFAERVTSALARFPARDSTETALLASVWEQAVQRGSRSGSLAEVLSLARVLAEKQLGLGILELPVSRLCQLEPFFWFAADLLRRIDLFRYFHNYCLAGYRFVNRVRSVRHPVPELLMIDHEWWEAPFRVWNQGDSQRMPVFVRFADGRLQVAAGAHLSGVFIDIDKDADCETLAKEIAGLNDRGIRFRTRALTTTLFTRLFLSDLFVHGIGGAKYDEMTDRLMRCYYNGPENVDLSAPKFLTVSATAWLPFASPHADTPADATRLRTMLRELNQNPQRHIPPDKFEASRSLVEEKERLIAEQHQVEANALAGNKPQHLGGRKRYRRLPQINRELAEFTQPQQREIRAELEAVEQRLAANAVLKCREFPFCLYPAARIEKMIADLDVEF